jgi:hypothetical protein
MESQYIVFVVCDIESWSGRPAVAQRSVRDSLTGALDDALRSVGVDPLSALRAGRGDGVVLGLPAATSKKALTTDFVDQVRDGLLRHAVKAAEDQQMRLRLVLHAGEGSFAEGEFAGAAVVEACRLVDSDVSRRALSAARGCPLVLLLSEPWYRSVVLEGYAPASGFERIAVREKNFRAHAWIRVPGLSRPPGLGPEDGPDEAGSALPSPPGPGPVPGISGGSIGTAISGGTFQGPVVTGGHFGGDLVMGDKNVGRDDGGDER